MPTRPTLPQTHGLTHLALRVPDPLRSARFYLDVFGGRITWNEPDHVDVQTPGSQDAISFMRGTKDVGRMAGVQHFGFRAKRATDIPLAVEAIQRAGGTIRDTGEFMPGEPYVFAFDLDGYEFELWFEPPPAPRTPKR